MSKRRLFLAGSAVVWLLLLAVVVKDSLDRLSVPPWGNPRSDGVPLKVEGGTRVGQMFVAPLPGLHRVEVWLDGAGEVVFHLEEAPPAGEDLGTVSLRPDDLGQEQPYGFDLPPIGNSKGRTYYFWLESPSTAPGDAVAVRYIPDAILDNASAYVNDEPVAGNLQFQTYYSLRTREKADLLLTRMAEGRPYILGTKGFYVGLVVVYALVLVAFLSQIADAVLAERKEES